MQSKSLFGKDTQQPKARNARSPTIVAPLFGHPEDGDDGEANNNEDAYQQQEQDKPSSASSETGDIGRQRHEDDDEEAEKPGEPIEVDGLDGRRKLLVPWPVYDARSENVKYSIPFPGSHARVDEV